MNQIQKKVNECPICNSNDTELHCTKNNLQYLKCKNCQHSFLSTTKDSYEYSSFYQSRTSHHASTKKINWDYSKNKYRYVYLPLLTKLDLFVKKGKLIDIGSSNGAFVKAATNFGWKAKGVELEKSSSDLARAHGVEVINNDLISAKLPATSIDCVTMWQLIEHIDDFDSLLNEIYRILRPGGILAVSTPNNQSIAWRLLGSKWRAVDPMVHLHLFSKKSLSKLFLTHDFEIAWSASYDIKPSTLSDYFSQDKSQENTSNQKVSVAEFTSDLNSFKLAILFFSLKILNKPLNWFNLGEDLYMFIRKPYKTN